MIQTTLKKLMRKTRAGRHGSSRLDHYAQALNLSYVLHERSDSATVAANLAAGLKHGRWLASMPASELTALPVVGLEDLASRKADGILTATIGAPILLNQLTTSLESQPRVVTADRESGGMVETTLFRGVARLALPGSPLERLVVAAATLRPGRRSIQISCAGPYRWPEDQGSALAALENLIRDQVTQWHPPRALWQFPAERSLPEMVDY